MSQPFKWTDANFKKAVALSKTSMTMTEIGKELGTTKNSVLGKLHRQKKERWIQSKEKNKRGKP